MKSGKSQAIGPFELFDRTNHSIQRDWAIKISCSEMARLNSNDQVPVLDSVFTGSDRRIQFSMLQRFSSSYPILIPRPDYDDDPETTLYLTWNS